jgi:TRAP-type C4-dicarboxylate transport system permease small subunit
VADTPEAAPAARPEGPVDWVDWVVLGFARGLNILSAVWLGAVALLIVYDVVGREFFNAPFHGTNEIVSNSVLSILMLQLPLSILTRGTLRTTILYGLMKRFGRSVIDVISYLSALALFLVIAFGSWSRMLEGWEILEQEGSGVVNIPVYPIRTLVVVVACFGIIVSLLMIWHAIFNPRKTDEMYDDLTEPRT